MLLDVKKKDGFRNYDDSEFAAPGPVFDSEDKMAALFDQMHDLKAEVSEGKVKSYDVLQKHLYKVLGIAGSAGAPAVTKPVTQAAKPATTAATIDEAGDGDDDGVDVDAIMADLK
jgi:hypothetical protein